nr:uncharacterized mitochondrial protein AtMg00810-like [Tanacetum cinerariifolium]
MYDDYIGGQPSATPRTVLAAQAHPVRQTPTAKPTKKHLKEVKRIFPYLRGTINMGLLYTKDSGFELTGFSDADYADLTTPSRVLSVELNSKVKSWLAGPQR